MQSKESVKIEHRLARNVDARTHRVILRLAIRHHNIQTVGRPALEDDDQALGARTWFSRAHSGASKKTRHSRRPNDSQRTVAKKNPTCNGHKTAPGGQHLSSLKLRRTQQQPRNRAYIRRTRRIPRLARPTLVIRLRLRTVLSRRIDL